MVSRDKEPIIPALKGPSPVLSNVLTSLLSAQSCLKAFCLVEGLVGMMMMRGTQTYLTSSFSRELKLHFVS